MRKISLRDIVFYLLILLLLVAVVMVLQGSEKSPTATYAELRARFEQEQVMYFEVDTDDNEITLVLWDTDNNGVNQTLVYPLASFEVFYSDMHELIDRQWEDGILIDYDYPPGFVAPWWLSMIPYLVVILIFGLLMYFLFLRRAGGTSAPAPAPWRRPAKRSASPTWPARTRKKPNWRRSWPS